MLTASLERVAVAGSLAVATLAALMLGSAQTWQWTLIACLGFLILVPLWLSDGAMPWSPVLLPMVGFGFLVGLQWALGWSVVPSATLTALAQLSGGLAFFCLGLACLGSPNGRRRTLQWAWGLCALLALEALLQFFSSGGYIYWWRDARYGSPFGPFVNRDDYAGFIELLLPLAMAWVARRWRTGSGAQAFLAWLAPGIAVVSVLVSSSRAGTVVVVAEVAAMALWLRRGGRTRGGRGWLGAAAALLLVSAALGLGWQPLLQRFADLGAGPGNARWQVLKVCWEVFRRHWAAGSGFGTFGWIYTKYQSVDTGLLWPYAHNDYAQAAAETGVAGLVLIALFLALYLRQGVAALRRLPREGVAAAAAFVGTLGLAAHSTLDFEFHIPANCYLFFLLAGMVCAPRRTRPARHATAEAHARSGAQEVA